jgi:hypothetical protein
MVGRGRQAKCRRRWGDEGRRERIGGKEDGGEGGAKPSAAGGGEMKGVGCR